RVAAPVSEPGIPGDERGLSVRAAEEELIGRKLEPGQERILAPRPPLLTDGYRQVRHRFAVESARSDGGGDEDRPVWLHLELQRPELPEVFAEVEASIQLGKVLGVGIPPCVVQQQRA